MALTAERNLGAKLRSASRIEAARLPRLKLIGAEWAEKLAERLAREFDAMITIEYSGATSLKLPEGGAAAAPVAMLAIATSPGWPQPALITVDAGFAGLVAECLFGGDGATTPRGDRKPTELDLRFCKLVLDRVLSIGNSVLAPIMEPDLVAERLICEGMAERLEELVHDGPVHFIQLAFQLTLGRCESTVNVAIPDAVLALHRRKLDRLPEPPPPLVDESWAREIEEGLQHADMQLTALLDEKQTTLGEIARFAVGQTIVLNTRVDSLITIECEEQRLFRGRMGRARDSYLVRIEEKIDPTEEFIDDILAE